MDSAVVLTRAIVTRNWRINKVTTENGFYHLRKEWNDLLRKSGSDTIFLTWEWIHSWWQNYKTGGQELHILTAYRNGELVGIAPLYSSPVRYLKVLTYRKLAFLGWGTTDSDYLDFIMKKGCEADVWERFMAYIIKQADKKTFLAFHEIPASSLTTGYISKAALELGLRLKETTHECAVTPLPGDWEAFLKSLQPRFRTKIRSSMRKLAESHHIEFSYCNDRSLLKEQLESLFELHQKHWEEKIEEGSFANQDRRSFYYDMGSLFFTRGWLRLYSLKVDGKYAAHQFCFKYNDRIFLLQEGFDPAWGNKSVGQVLRGYVFRHAMEEGIREYDFLGEMSPHKESWGARPKSSVNMILYKPSLYHFLYFNLADWKEKLKLILGKLIPAGIIRWRKEWKEKMLRRRIQRRILERKTKAGLVLNLVSESDLAGVIEMIREIPLIA